MRTILPCTLLLACAPTVAEVIPVSEPGGSEPVGFPDPAGCDDSFVAEEAWTARVEHYGQVRGLARFTADGEVFELAGGIYDPMLDRIDARDGAVLSSERTGALVLDRHQDAELHRDQGRIHLIGPDGRVRWTRTSWEGSMVRPQVAMATEHLASFACSDTGRLTAERLTLRGMPTTGWSEPTDCGVWQAPPVDLHGTRFATAIDGRGLLMTADGSATVLSEHEAHGSAADPVIEVRFGPDGTVLATAGSDGRLIVHEVPSGRVLLEREINAVPLNRNIYAETDTRAPFAWSADGRLLARGVHQQILVERLCDGEIIAELDQRDDLGQHFGRDEGLWAFGLHFSPDGRTLIARYQGGLQAFVRAD